MRIGLSMLYCLGLPFSGLLKQLQTVNVKNVELVDEGFHGLNKRRVYAIKRIVDERGLRLTVHGPFIDINISSTDAPTRRNMLKRLKRSIKLSGNLSSNLWVFHSGLMTGVSHFYPGLDWELNLKSLQELKAEAEKDEVRLAIENTPDPFPFLLRNVEDFTRFFKDLGDTDLEMTLDVGHAHINKQIYTFIEKFPDRITHAHVHDNNGDFDRHLGIGYGNIDWPRVVESFKKVNFKGTLIIESEKNIFESLEKLKELLK